MLCPSCKSPACDAVGQIPDSSRFAGAVLEQALPGGVLCRCKACSLWFRHPRLAKEVLDRLYQDGSAEAWNAAGTQRPDWRLVKQTLCELVPGGRVLDVGCSDGELLAQIGPRYSRFGLELNRAAAQQARLRGVIVVEHDLHNLARCDRRFDAIIATDVIEHTHDPLGFLRDCVRLLSPGGVVLITTGDTEARSWRLMKGQYWYCANAEHLSFLNESWIRYAARLLSLDVLRLQRFAHDRCISRCLAQAALNLAYRVSPALVAVARRSFARDKRTRQRPDLMLLPPSWSTATDHFLVALGKAGGQ
jgi:SAM-dependent methyltransferase